MAVNKSQEMNDILGLPAAQSLSDEDREHMILAMRNFPYVRGIQLLIQVLTSKVKTKK